MACLAWPMELDIVSHAKEQLQLPASPHPFIGYFCTLSFMICVAGPMNPPSKAVPGLELGKIGLCHWEVGLLAFQWCAELVSRWFLRDHEFKWPPVSQTRYAIYHIGQDVFIIPNTLGQFHHTECWWLLVHIACSTWDRFGSNLGAWKPSN